VWKEKHEEDSNSIIQHADGHRKRKHVRSKMMQRSRNYAKVGYPAGETPTKQEPKWMDKEVLEFEARIRQIVFPAAETHLRSILKEAMFLEHSRGHDNIMHCPPFEVVASRERDRLTEAYTSVLMNVGQVAQATTREQVVSAFWHNQRLLYEEAWTEEDYLAQNDEFRATVRYIRKKGVQTSAALELCVGLLPSEKAYLRCRRESKWRTTKLLEKAQTEANRNSQYQRAIRWFDIQPEEAPYYSGDMVCRNYARVQRGLPVEERLRLELFVGRANQRNQDEVEQDVAQEMRNNNADFPIGVWEGPEAEFQVYMAQDGMQIWELHEDNQEGNP
jgi:hypothetical protein